jgi:beta-galactosidase
VEKKYPPISTKLPRMMHGGDYNPDQWLEYPEVLKEDIRLMKLANCNTVSVGIFSWVGLEREEGVFSFEWLDNIINDLYANGIYTVLSTPSGARPAWMAEKYPEVLRVTANRVRNLYGERHNHCFSSPVYREKVRIMNTKLAEKYSDHPGVIAWHISNEYSGECHCDICQEEFRKWLKEKYGSLENLNRTWWSSFWSHTLTSWSQIQSPSTMSDNRANGLSLSWRRFVTDQTVDFCKQEIKPFKDRNPEMPVTTNMMGTYTWLNYWKFKDILDVISWDNYPCWHEEDDDTNLGASISMVHDINRSFKGGKPFMLMESTPSVNNWLGTPKLKRPGMHLLSSLQAVAHGSDSVLYFQWRKSRGSSEKFHGAVVDHNGHENTRVFRDVTEVGEVLASLDEVIGSTVKAEVGIIFDWENKWAINNSHDPQKYGKKYDETVTAQYKPFWKSGIPVDILDMDCDISDYKLLIAPMMYMVRPGVGEKIEKFVKNGGTFVATYLTGVADENDLCFLDGFPGPLRKVLGIWSEEVDCLYSHNSNHIVFISGNSLSLKGEFQAKDFCELIHTEGAETLAVYKDDFYAGRPALTVNSFGAGKAYYVASRNNEEFNDDFYNQLIKEAGLKRNIEIELPDGVTAQRRSDAENDFVFIMNFGTQERQLKLDDKIYSDLVTGEQNIREITLPLYGLRILKRRKQQ